MKILYKQPPESDYFKKIGVRECLVKALCEKKDKKLRTARVHHHTCFEIHIIQKGQQKYKTRDEVFNADNTCILIIPPGREHRNDDVSVNMEKISLLFKAEPESPFASITEPICLEKTAEIDKGIELIILERETATSFSEIIVENRIFEIFIRILRLYGYKEKRIQNEEMEDVRLLMAKQYIKDNIENKLSVLEVSAYCYLSSKQLTRLFLRYQDTTPAAYIQKKKIEHMEKLLMGDLSLKSISEKMSFSSEYYFNAFFKKYAGMPPGEYRKMVKQ